MSEQRQARRYRFEPLDASGVFLGLGVVQSALVGGGLLLGVVALSTGAPLAAAALPALVGAAVSFTRVRGRPAWEWLPLLAGWVWMRLGRGPRWFARLPLVVGEAADAVPLPPCLDGLSILEVPWRGRRTLGALRDAQDGTLSVVVPVAGPQFALAEPATQEHLLAGWGEALNQFATEGSAVARVSWSDFVRPSGMSDHRDWLDAETVEIQDSEAADSYRRLVAETSSRASEHEVLVTLTVAAERLGRRYRTVGDPEAALAEALCSSLDSLLRALRSAELEPGEPLGRTGVARALRSRTDPALARPRPVRGRLVERLGLVAPESAGPLAVEAAWSHVRVDAAYHRTFWIASWPRLAVPPAWLEPFLSAAGVTRTMTVVFVPVPARQSRRRIEKTLVKLESDAATKEDKGRRVDARHQRATQALLEREEELVAGYAEVAYAGVVTVSADSAEDLDEESAIVEQLARECGMELRALDGRHDLGWATALPLGLAPKTLLA